MLKIIRELKQRRRRRRRRRRRQRERQKSERLMLPTNNFARASLYFAVVKQLQRESA